jgi:hypothetical protein
VFKQKLQQEPASTNIIKIPKPRTKEDLKLHFTRTHERRNYKAFNVLATPQETVQNGRPPKQPIVTDVVRKPPQKVQRNEETPASKDFISTRLKNRLMKK